MVAHAYRLQGASDLSGTPATGKGFVRAVDGSMVWTDLATQAELDAVQAAAIQAAIVTAKGDLVGASGNGAPVRVPAGTVDGQILTRDAASAAGVKWGNSIPPRPQVMQTGYGLITANLERQAASNQQSLTDGVAYFMAIGLLAGDVVSNVCVNIILAGVALTLSKAGFYKKDGTQLAASADQGTSWQSTGAKSAAMAVPYVVPTTDIYYACVIAKATTTMPQMFRGASSNLLTAFSGGSAPIGTQTGQVDLPSPATIGFGTPFALWVGVS